MWGIGLTIKNIFYKVLIYVQYMCGTGTGANVHAHIQNKEDKSGIAVFTLWSSVLSAFEI